MHFLHKETPIFLQCEHRLSSFKGDRQVFKESAKMYEEQSACYNIMQFLTMHATCMHDM